MSEISETYDCLRQVRTAEKRARRDKASIDFPLVAQAASAVGIRVVAHGDIHYQFRCPGGVLLDVYPSNQRICRDQNHSQAPHLDLPDVWGLADVLRALSGGTVKVETIDDLVRERDELQAELARLRESIKSSEVAQ